MKFLHSQSEGAEEYFALEFSDAARALVSAAIRYRPGPEQDARLQAAAASEHWIALAPCDMLRSLAYRCAVVLGLSATP